MSLLSEESDGTDAKQVKAISTSVLEDPQTNLPSSLHKVDLCVRFLADLLEVSWYFSVHSG